MGNADVRVSFKSRKHDLNVSTYALIILLLFQDVDDLTYEVKWRSVSDEPTLSIA